MDQEWPYPDFTPSIATSQGGREEVPPTEQGNPVAERNPVDRNPVGEANPYLWYPQSSWDMSNPAFAAYHHPSLNDPLETSNPISPDFDPQAIQQFSANSSEYGSIYTPTKIASGAFDDRPTPQISQHQFQYPRDLEGNMDAGPMGDAAGTSSSSVIDPRGRGHHHHFMRGRSADDLNRERVSSVERRRTQNRASQRAFRKRKEERLKELENIVAELETRVKSLEDRNRELEGRNGEVEGWNRDLVARVGALEEELEGLRG